MTNQELFDTVATHLLRQGKRASEGGGYDCRYRTEPDQDGVVLKCAVGCLIPDERYRPEFENTPVTGGTPVARAAGLLGPTQANLAWLLQTVHDRDTPPLWRVRLSNIGAAHGLSTAILDTCEDNTGGTL